MNLTISSNTQLSLRQIAELAKTASVMQTPHVGSLPPEDLILTSLGIPQLVYDRAMSLTGDDCRPHGIIINRGFKRAGSPALLPSHARVEQSPGFDSIFQVGRRLAHCHLEAVKLAMPQARLQLQTQYLTHYADVVQLVIEICYPETQKSWGRYVESTGKVQQRPSLSLDELLCQGIYGVTNEREGWLIPNILNPLIAYIAETLATKRPDIYHLSGYDMTRYIWKYAPLMDQLYQKVGQAFPDWSLPSTGQFIMLPSASVRWAICSSQQQELDQLINCWLSLRELFPATKYPDSKSLTAAVKQRTGGFSLGSKHMRPLVEVVRNCREVFYDPTCDNYFSQYDILAGRSLYVPNWILETPIEEISIAVDLFDQVNKALKKQA